MGSEPEAAKAQANDVIRFELDLAKIFIPEVERRNEKVGRLHFRAASLYSFRRPFQVGLSQPPRAKDLIPSVLSGSLQQNDDRSTSEKVTLPGLGFVLPQRLRSGTRDPLSEQTTVARTECVAPEICVIRRVL